jgi:simple sugar transport system permease protein
LILTSAAATMAFRAGAINMGMAGQFMVGGSVASMAAAALAGVPTPLHLPLTLVCAALGGAAAGFVPAFFKRVSGINEVITGMIANLMMPHLLSAVVSLLPLLRGVRFAARRGIPETALFAHFAQITNGGLGSGTKANTSIFLAIGLALFLQWWIRRSTLGFEIRMTKANYSFAEFAGIRASRGFYLGMMLSGAIAALAGASEVLGVWHGYRGGTLVVGEKGLVISLIGAQTFVGSMIVALIYGGLESGTMNVSWFTSIPRPLIDVIVLLIFLLSAVPAMRSFFTGSDPTESEHLGGRFVTTWR